MAGGLQRGASGGGGAPHRFPRCSCGAGRALPTVHELPGAGRQEPGARSLGAGGEAAAAAGGALRRGRPSVSWAGPKGRHPRPAEVSPERPGGGRGAAEGPRGAGGGAGGGGRGPRRRRCGAHPPPAAPLAVTGQRPPRARKVTETLAGPRAHAPRSCPARGAPGLVVRLPAEPRVGEGRRDYGSRQPPRR